MDSPTLVGQMGTLISAGLINEETPGQYTFRHALMREAVYANLLIKDRKRFHRAIGETITSLFGDELDAHLSDLSFHFYEAGAWEQALEYARRAGERARALYAPKEAIEHLSRALDAARHLQSPLLSTLYRERGHAFEISGDFEHARADYESSLVEARAHTDRRSEWEALVGLGFLWASRNYGQTGEYLEQALALARAMEDPGILGHTLNRVGNWYLNKGAADQALQYHREALSLFQQLDDPSGIAETADLLGLTYGLQGNLSDSSLAFKQAIVLFRSMDDRRGLSSALANSALRGVFSVNDFYIPSDKEYVRVLAEAEEAVRLSHDIGWRAGEAFAQAVFGSLFSSTGHYDRSLDLLVRSLQLSQEIGHRQWTLFGHMAMGGLYLNFLELNRAQQHYEAALAFAREVRSTNFARPLSGLVAIVLIRKGGRPSIQRAEEILQTCSPGNLVSNSFGQQNIDNARIELALAREEYLQALDLVNQRITELANWAPHAVAAQMRLYKAQALVALHRLAESELVLRDLMGLLPAESTRPFLWRVHAALGHVYRRQRHHAESQAQFTQACRIIDELSVSVSDQALRDNFRKSAYAQIPQACRPAPKRRLPASRSAKPSPRKETPAPRNPSPGL